MLIMFRGFVANALAVTQLPDNDYNVIIRNSLLKNVFAQLKNYALVHEIVAGLSLVYFKWHFAWDDI